MTSSPLKILNIDHRHLATLVQLCEQYHDLNWNQTKLQSSLDAVTALALGLFVDDVLQCFCLGFVVMDEAELLLIATDAAFLQRGYAAQVLQEFLQQARVRSVKKVFLEVRASNLAAIHLYERFGFKTVHVRKAYYAQANGREDALVMELSLTDN